MDLVFYLTLLSISLWAVASILYWSIVNGITPTPSSRRARMLMIANLPLTEQGPIYELGCGFGSLLFPLAKKLPDHQIIGYETSTIPFLICKLRSIFTPNSNLKILKYDFFNEDFRSVSLVICYLYPAAMQRLKSKFEQELPQGCWVVSNTFAIPGWIPHKIIQAKDLYNSKIYIYKFSLEEAGTGFCFREEIARFKQKF